VEGRKKKILTHLKAGAQKNIVFGPDEEGKFKLINNRCNGSI